MGVGRIDSRTDVRHDEANSRFPQFCERPEKETLKITVLLVFWTRYNAIY